ncbi:MAG: LamG-like jellyroll fold domain-containing protein [Cellulomonas sp.]
MLVALNLGGGAASAYWSADSAAGGSGLAAPSGTVNPGNPPTANAAKNDVVVSWTASTLSNGAAVSGYVVKRFVAVTLVPATVLSGCTGTIAAVTLTCTEIGVPEGRWVYSVTPKFATNWTGAESPRSDPVASDANPPTNVITFSGVAGGAFKVDNTVYYRGGSLGSFTLTNSLTDTSSGPASSTIGALTPAPGRVTYTPPAQSGPPKWPYVSGLFRWSASTDPATSTQGMTVTGMDSAGNTALTTLSLMNDSTPPAGGKLTYYNGITAKRSVSVAFAAVTDSGSGVKSRELQRAEANLTGSVCGSWGQFQTVTGGTNPTSSLTDAVAAGHCYKYQYVAWDNVGNQKNVSSLSVVKVRTYFDEVNATAGLLSYWRLGESAALVDAFDGPAVPLQDWTGAGMVWTRASSSTTNASLNSRHRIQRTGDNKTAMYSTSVEPVSADYTVGADVVSESKVKGDRIGLVGRFDAAAGTYYSAFYDRSSSDRNSCWILEKVVTSNHTRLGQKICTSLEDGYTYRLELVMAGSQITLRVDGEDLVSVVDSDIGGAGHAGVFMDFTQNKTQAAGLELDNFTLAPMVDSNGSNDGVYLNEPTLGVEGAIPGDSNNAATFDGVDDYGRVARQISDDFSIEFWFSSRQTSGTGQEQWTGSQWWQGAGLVDAEVDGAKSDFGVSLFSDGRVVAGVGWSPSDVSILSNHTYNDGKWHHVVFTRNHSTGAMALYVDGSVEGETKNGDTGSLTDSKFLTFGRIQTGTYSFAGSLDEIAVYTTVLTPETVQAHYVPVP